MNDNRRWVPARLWRRESPRFGGQRWLTRIVATVSAASAVLILSPVTAGAVTATAGAWNGQLLNRNSSQPIYNCVAQESGNNGNGTEFTASSFAQCDILVDNFAYTWTWIDENTGATLLSLSGSVQSTTSLSASSASSVGSLGHRTVKICYTTYVAGYDPAGSCNMLNHV